MRAKAEALNGMGQCVFSNREFYSWLRKLGYTVRSHCGTVEPDADYGAASSKCCLVECIRGLGYDACVTGGRHGTVETDMNGRVDEANEDSDEDGDDIFVSWSSCLA